MDDDGLSRRELLRNVGMGVLGGAAVGGGGALGLSAYREAQDPLPATVYVSQTQQLAAYAELLRDDRDHALDRMEEYLEPALEDLYDRAGLPSPEIRTTDEEPVVEGEDIDDVLADWDDAAEVEGSAHLLLSHESYGPGGVAESGNDLGIVESCGTGAEHSDVGVLGTADDLLYIEPGEVYEEVLVEDYDVATGERFMHSTPHTTAIAGVHEVGHNLCLHHDAGTIETEGQEHGKRLYTSVMAASYTIDTAEDQGIEIGDKDDIYWSARFSDGAVARVRDEYTDLL